MDNVHISMKNKMHLSSYNLQEVSLNILLNIFYFFLNPVPHQSLIAWERQTTEMEKERLKA